jgi:SNF2 family DNA or RNA helicase
VISYFISNKSLLLKTKEFKYCDLVPWRASRSNLLFDLHNGKILTPEAVSDYIGSFKSRGGILADAVGLGKTLESRSLLSNNCDY